jgi:hypothetical protein
MAEWSSVGCTIGDLAHSTLGNTSDEIIIRNGTPTIDSVVYMEDLSGPTHLVHQWDS